MPDTRCYFRIYVRPDVCPSLSKFESSLESCEASCKNVVNLPMRLCYNWTMTNRTAEDGFGVPSLDVQVMPITVEQTLPLRHSVLWPDLPISHVQLPEDSSGFHYGAFLSSHLERPVAVISLFSEPLPGPGRAESNDLSWGMPAVRFRKFACTTTLQGRGIGTRLLEYIIAIARSELGAKVVWCDARRFTSDWYEKRGFHIFGEPFMKGPVEYIRMKITV